MQINKVILLGLVGKDPQVRYLESGTAVATFPLATSESYKNKNGERVTTTQWHNIVVWRRQAEIVEQYVRKGSELYIEGKIRSRSWQGEDGIKRYVTEIVANEITLGRRPASESQNQQQETQEEENTPATSNDTQEKESKSTADTNQTADTSQMVSDTEEKYNQQQDETFEHTEFDEEPEEQDDLPF